MSSAGATLEWNSHEVMTKIQAALQEEIEINAKFVLKKASRQVPQKYSKKGNLRKTGRIVYYQNRGSIGAYVHFGGQHAGVDAFYSRFVELGTPGRVYQWGKTKRGRARIGKVRTPVERIPFLSHAINKRKRTFSRRVHKVFKT